jgi:hypothetical protein
MNNKITLEALKLAGFQNPTAIAEILNYVPNPNAALEMLLGIHEPKVVDPDNSFRRHRYSSENKYAEITGYNELADTVQFRVLRQKTVTMYAITEEDYKNNTLVFEKPSKYYHSKEVPSTGYTSKTDSSTTKDFEDMYKEKVDIYQMSNVIGVWNEFGIPEESNMAF